MPPKRKRESPSRKVPPTLGELRPSPRDHATEREKALDETAGSSKKWEVSEKAKAAGDQAKAKDREPGSTSGKWMGSMKAKATARDIEASLKGKRARAAAVKGKENVAENEEEVKSESFLSRKIVIEACNQCKSFTETAEMLKRGLEASAPNISVEINPEKPREGYFEVREEKKEVLLSLQNMKRPFTPMKQLDMDAVIQDIFMLYA